MKPLKEKLNVEDVEEDIDLLGEVDEVEVIEKLERHIKSFNFFEKKISTNPDFKGTEVALKSFEAHEGFMKEVLHFLRENRDSIDDMDENELWHFVRERYAEYLLR